MKIFKWNINVIFSYYADDLNIKVVEYVHGEMIAMEDLGWGSPAKNGDTWGL